MEYLKDSLTYLIDNFKPTKAQNTEYPDPQGQSKRITHDMLGCDHPKALRLLKQDGWNNETVGKMKASCARRIWEYGCTNHMFPSTAELVRLGVFFHIDMYCTLALVLKGAWENFCAHYCCWPKSGETLYDILREEDHITTLRTKFKDLIIDHTDGELDKLIAKFTFTNYHEIFVYIKQYFDVEGYSENSFKYLLQEMTANNFHIAGIESNGLKDFSSKKTVELKLLINNKNEGKEKNAFFEAKCTWLEKSDKLDQYLLIKQSRLLQNKHIEMQWMKKFGKEELAIKKEIINLKFAQKRYEYKSANPLFTKKQIEELIQKLKDKEKEKLEAFELEISLAKWIGGIPGESQPDKHETSDSKELYEYMEKFKHELRTLYFMLFEDKLKLTEAYGKATEKQKEKLKQLWNEVMEIRNQELKYKPGQIGYYQRTLERLLEIKSKARAILETAGIEIKEEMVIMGDTLAEQIEWLKNSIESLNKAIKKIRTEILVLNENEDIKRKRDILSYPEQHSQIKSELQKQYKSYLVKVNELNNKFEALFKKDI